MFACYPASAAPRRSALLPGARSPAPAVRVVGSGSTTINRVAGLEFAAADSCSTATRRSAARCGASTARHTAHRSPSPLPSQPRRPSARSTARDPQPIADLDQLQIGDRRTSSLVSVWKMMISSIRFGNSGRKVSFQAAARSFAQMAVPRRPGSRRPCRCGKARRPRLA